MKTNKPDWESIVRRAVEDSGLSRYKIAIESGITQSQLSYFMSGQRTITLPTAEKIAHIVGLELTPKRKRGKDEDCTD